MSQCILLIDDDEALHSLLGPYLEQVGFRVAHALDGRQGLAGQQQRPADLILLDIMLPGMDGWEICRLIRQESPVPIIMLTAKGEEIDKLRGFQLGVDDYVTKPFSFAELTARIKAVLNRSASANQPAISELHFSDLTIDVDRHLVRRGDQLIDLTPTEFRLLHALVSRAGRICPAELLLQEVWGPEYINDTGYIRRYIWFLRQKLEPDPAQPRYIHTEREFGYMFQVG
jgi:DNA-binding response OmpR family regulator